MKKALLRDTIVLIALALITLWYVCLQPFFPLIGTVALLLGVSALPFVYRVAKNTAEYIRQRK